MKFNYPLATSLLISILSISHFTKSQEYLPFPEDNAIWYSLYSYAWPYPPYVWYYTYQYETEGDTIINQLCYTKLYNGIVGSGYRFYDGAYRIDYESERVYYVDPMYGTESLLYDFNLVPGDTISIINGGIEACKMICLDTASMIINGVPHYSLFMYAFSDFDECYTIWVKGIGSLSMPLETDIFCGHSFETAFDLTCFYYKGEEIYKWEGNPYFEGCIGNNVGINEDVLDFSYNIFPNPITDVSKILCISCFPSLYDYSIYSMNGMELKSQSQVALDEIIIYRSNFLSGMYLMRVYSHREHKYYSMKFIVD